MNSTIGIEYAYARIHKLEVEVLAYKDKIAELKKRLSHSETMGDKAQEIRDIEQQAKGVMDFFASVEPKISMGESKLWELQTHNVNCYLDNLRNQAKGGAE